MTGDQAAAEAMRQIDPDVVPAYPITPQTEIVMTFAQFVADGIVKTEMIPVESEHSAMSACVGASAAGARVMTATSANGLALMWEILYIASGLRLPIVMPLVNRALSAPINIHCDHSDGMGARDSGWIQMYCETAQEVYESMFLAVKIAEDNDILLPVMVCQDGFITSHATEAIDTIPDDEVKKYIGEYTPLYPLLDIKNPVTYGPLDLTDYYFEHKRQESEGMKKAYEKIPKICADFSKFIGSWHGLVESYRMEDAERAILVLSSTAGTTKAVVDELREKGEKVGMIRPKFFRPFPAVEIAEACKKIKTLAILDRAEGFSNQGGPLFAETRAALYTYGRILPVKNYIFGLGGRDITTVDIGKVYEDLKSPEKGDTVTYLGVRE